MMKLIPVSMLALLALLAAIPPLATLPVEVWFRRRGLLSTPRPAAAPGALAG